jgi:DeoR/GlpR family transcriptional regulator of sugar metabolism
MQMSVEERKRLIVERINKQGRVTISEICDLYDVSDMTARRDLRDLDQIGLVHRVHGGAVSSIGRSYEPAYNVRAMTNHEAKKAIGQKAAEFVHDGDSISLDTGTTTVEFARALKEKRNLTIVTNSLTIANEIVSSFSLINDVRLILTGGIVRSVEFSMIGDIAQNTYNTHHVDKAFMGISGVSLEAGLTEYNLDDAQIIKAAISSAQQNIILADSSKLERITFAKVGKLSDVDRIITDQDAPPDLVEKLTKLGLDVIVAKYK